jgi:hypothetical protein
MIHAFATADAFEHPLLFLEPVLRNNQRDRTADRLCRCVPEQLLCGGIPAGDNSVQVLPDDRVVRGFHYRGESGLGLFLAQPVDGMERTAHAVARLSISVPL